MNVAIVTHNVVRGDGQGHVNYELTRFLLREGVNVFLLADRVADELVEAGAEWLPVHPGFDELHLVKVWRFKQLANKALDHLSDKIDVTLGCGVTLDRPHELNAVHFVHGTWLESPFHASRVASGVDAWYQWLFSSANARWERRVFDQAQQVIAVSDMVREELVAIGVPDEKIEVIVNGVDTLEFAPGSVDRRALGLPEDVPLGLFVGDIRSPIKNLDGVLRAMVDVPDVHLAVAGSLSDSPYPALADDLGLNRRVHFLGFRKDIPQLMRGADFFALPSRRDSCPLVLLEAMASGLPVIVSTNVGTSNLVSRAAGFVLESPDDRAGLVDALRLLTHDQEKRVSMGRAAREVAEQYTWQRMAEQYLSLMRQHTETTEIPG